jgi:DNA repair exonuclease SbcCD ATPase subunit
VRIQKASIKNIQAIKALVWRPPKNSDVGWHVILGDNGSGKTSFLRALSLALLGPDEAIAGRQNWNNWVRQGAKKGEISLDIVGDRDYDIGGGEGSKNVIVAKVSESAAFGRDT